MGKLIALLPLFICLNTFALDKVRLGWQIPWAVQGQLVQILKHTDIAKKHQLEFEFIGRTFGPMLNELAFGKSVDVILTADQPASVLFRKTSEWKVIARLMYNRTSTYVPQKSPLKTLSELKGKVIGVPIGAAAERIAYEALAQSGLDASKDVKWVNVDIREHMVLAQKHKNDSSFAQFTALAGFDPTGALLESMGLVRTLHVGKVVSVIVAHQKVTNNESLMLRIREAFKEAYRYYQKNTAQANEWFMNEAMIPFNSQEACALAASIEPNLSLAAIKEGGEINLELSPADVELMQKASDFVNIKMKGKIKVTDFIDSNALSSHD